MVNKEKIEEGVRLLLEGIGEDTEREGLLETPQRIARMYEELFAGMDQDAAEPLSRQFDAVSYTHLFSPGPIDVLSAAAI